MLLDGTVAETDRVQNPGHFSGKLCREGVNLQVITAEEGKLLWLSPALPGGPHDVKAAREHDIIGTCAQLDSEILADKGYQGAGGTIITPIKRRPATELTDKHKKSNKVHAGLRASVERPPRPHKPEQTHVSRRSHPHPHDLHVKMAPADHRPALNRRVTPFDRLALATWTGVSVGDLERGGAFLIG
ncbi:transposase family protein [Streptomyces sp. 1222.5]|uniref:transposase family protein n=1 Tax=Streptomyces sp. 1222.5 TaxID=1881026 RepID=UPI003D70C31F